MSIQSNDVLILLDNTPVTGCLSYNLSPNINTFAGQHLGSQLASGYVKGDIPNHSLSLEWAFGPQSIDEQIGGRSSTNNYFSSGFHEVIIRDTVEQQLISGAYLNGFGIDLSVGEVPRFSASFECDTIDSNTDSLTTKGEDSLTGSGSGIFDPHELQINSINLLPFFSNNEDCIQSINISVGIPRTPITRIGTRIPQTRAIREPANIQVGVSALKQTAKNFPANYFNDFSQSTGQMVILFDTKPASEQLTATIQQLTFVSMQEELDTNGREVITYNYNGLFNSESFSIR